MIRQLRGEVVDSGPGFVTILVGGVGYKVATTMTEANAVGSEVLLHTYLAVSETALDLYGFIDEAELAVFELLLTLPKIGPKSALQILAQTDLATLADAVAANDAGSLSKLSGIGKKSAEKIVAGLQDKQDVFVAFGHSGNGEEHADQSAYADSVDALITLGYAESAARTALKEVQRESAEPLPAGTAIKKALVYLTK